MRRGDWVLSTEHPAWGEGILLHRSSWNAADWEWVVSFDGPGGPATRWLRSDQVVVIPPRSPQLGTCNDCGFTFVTDQPDADDCPRCEAGSMTIVATQLKAVIESLLPPPGTTTTAEARLHEQIRAEIWARCVMAESIVRDLPPHPDPTCGQLYTADIACTLRADHDGEHRCGTLGWWHSVG